MQEDRLQDTIRRGLGRAARAAGSVCDAYRPDGAGSPLRPGCRYLRLPVLFSPAAGVHRVSAHGHPLWNAAFDAAYSRPGDYLVRKSDGAVFFIAAQPPLLPVLCVLTDRTVSFSRPSGPGVVGAGSYGGVQRATATTLLQTWPASVVAIGDGGFDASLPADMHPATWTVLLPGAGADDGGPVLRGGDLMTDDLGRYGVVTSAELSSLGWRLHVRQAAA
jgi:hypothetical protein